MANEPINGFIPLLPLSAVIFKRSIIEDVESNMKLAV